MSVKSTFVLNVVQSVRHVILNMLWHVKGKPAKGAPANQALYLLSSQRKEMLIAPNPGIGFTSLCPLSI